MSMLWLSLTLGVQVASCVYVMVESTLGVQVARCVYVMVESHFWCTSSQLCLCYG